MKKWHVSIDSFIIVWYSSDRHSATNLFLLVWCSYHMTSPHVFDSRGIVIKNVQPSLNTTIIQMHVFKPSEYESLSNFINLTADMRKISNLVCKKITHVPTAELMMGTRVCAYGVVVLLSETLNKKFIRKHSWNKQPWIINGLNGSYWASLFSVTMFGLAKPPLNLSFIPYVDMDVIAYPCPETNAGLAYLI